MQHYDAAGNLTASGGRLASVGLTGGFGSFTLGQIWSASYNHVGAITDKSAYFGNATTSYRHGSGMSYSYSSGPVSFQLDLMSDGGMDTGQGVDKTEFGVTVAMGEVGRVALAHTNQRDQMVTSMTERVPGTPGTPYIPEMITTPAVDAVPATPDTFRVRRAATTAETNAGETGNPGGMTEARMITVHITGAQNIATNVANGKLNAVGVELVQRTGDRYHAAGALAAECVTLAEDNDATNDCTTATAFVSSVTTTAETVAAGGGAPTPGTTTEDYHIEGTAIGNVVRILGTTGTPARDAVTTDAVPGVPGTAETPPMGVPTIVPGFKRTHVAIEFNVGGMTPYLGHSVDKANMGMMLDTDSDSQTYNTVIPVAATETKTTHYGIGGGLGDTGMSYLVMGRTVKAATGAKTNPWLVNVSKSLGGGATVIFEHGNADDGMSGTSRVGLHVTF